MMTLDWQALQGFGLSTFTAISARSESGNRWLNGAMSAVWGAAGKMKGPAGKLCDAVGLASLSAFLRS